MRKTPTFWVRNAEKGCHINEVSTLTPDLQVEVGIDLTLVVSLCAVEWSLDFDSDIKRF